MPSLRSAAPLLLLLILAGGELRAQFFYFGRNKVQYTDFAWQVLKTDHFDVYYYPEMRALAERGAHFAEEAYAELEQRFNHSLGGRTPLIFYSSHLHFQQTNTIGGFIPEGVGGFFEFLKGRVVIPSDGSVAQFRHVIRHELVHVFMHSKVNRVLTDHRKPADRFPPLWFVEGLAEYWSTEWDTQAEMVMRDAVLNDNPVGITSMDRYFGSFVMYKAGQAILEYIGSRYGEEKILLLIENMWKVSTFNEVFLVTLGKDYAQFDEEWIYALKKRYYPLLADRDIPSSASRLLVREGFNAKPVVYERDSLRHLLYVGNRTGYTDIYARTFDARTVGEEVRIVEGERSDQFESFHPFRSKIDVSRDGLLAFVTKSGEHDVLHLYDLARGEVTETFRFRSLVSIGSASWAPDGVRLAFTSIDKSGNNDLYVLDTRSRELRRLTNDFYDDRDPAWHPTADRIAFSSDRTAWGRDGTHNLFLLDVATGAIDYLTCGPEDANAPAWSKDGRILAFTCDADGTENIWVIPVDSSTGRGTMMQQLTRFTTSAFDPSWTSAGELVFTAFEKFSFRVRMLSGVPASVETLSTVRPIILADRGEPWRPVSLGGDQESKRYRYEGEYSLDIAQSAISTDPVFGTRAGAFIALSDVMGNDQYYFTVYNTAETQDEILSSFNLAISRISLSQRTGYAYGVYRFRGRRYDLTDPDEYFYERVFGGYFALNYPLSKFERLESVVSLSNSNKDADLRFEDRKALLLSNSLSFVHDNSLWGPTGPLDGNRFSLTLAYTTDIQYSNVNYFSVIADYRHYVRLATTVAFASRFWIFYNEGRESRRFVMGGSWDLRGWPRWSIRGEKLWLTSHELRFPFLDALAFRFPFGGVSFGSFRGALFVDAGSAWDEEYRETLGSVGGGLRMNLGGVMVLRYDIGKLIVDNFSAFAPGIFQQFFFGWDF